MRFAFTLIIILLLFASSLSWAEQTTYTGEYDYLHSPVFKRSFEKVWGKKCRHFYIQHMTAESIARRIAKNEFDVKPFLTNFYINCSVDEGMEIAAEVKAGKLSQRVYTQARKLKCNIHHVLKNDGSRYMNYSQAKKVAYLVQQKELNPQVFFKLWRESCDFQQAFQQAVKH